MCFTNLPIEFDEDGNPYLKEEAEDVDQPDCGCDAGNAVEEVDPREAYEEVVAAMPDDVREQLGESDADRATEPATKEVSSD